jgi:hypothetical protein
VFTAWDADVRGPRSIGEYVSTASIPPQFLNDGDFSFSVALVSPGGKIQRHFKQERLLSCKIIDVSDPERLVGNVTRGVVRPELVWESSVVDPRSGERAGYATVR